MAEQKITPRATDYSQWYLDVIEAGALADNSPVKGCIVFRPHGYAIWEAIRDGLDARFKETGHVNAYFPLLVPLSFFSKEAALVEGFAKECAVVTHHRLRIAEGGGIEPDPTSKLEEPYIIRPTSETTIWHMYGKWIESWRDLPILINQWANVMRWEMRTRPFLRTAEFLWQEGHTAHATRDEAEAKARQMLGVYTSFARDALAIPSVPGAKTASERFAGAVDTYTYELMMQNGWALQGGTSHFLGQNFAKAFDVTFQNQSGEREHVWATSWGVSTRLIGAVIMTHSDDTGLVLPPRVAPVQVAIVPIWKSDEEMASVLAFADKVAALLKGRVRVKVDTRDGMKPGAKYFEWERKGVPLRLEIGPRDVQGNSVFAAKRTGGKKFGIPVGDDFADAIQAQLDAIHGELLKAAEERLAARTYVVQSYDELKAKVETDSGFYLAAWHDDAENEARIKEETKCTIRCYPLDQQDGATSETCFFSGRPATHRAIFARSY